MTEHRATYSVRVYGPHDRSPTDRRLLAQAMKEAEENIRHLLGYGWDARIQEWNEHDALEET